MTPNGSVPPPATRRGVVAWWDRHQIPWYLAAIGIGVLLGVAAPPAAPVLELGIEPVLMALLFATFLGVPLIEVGRAFTDVRFVTAVLVANFVAVPALVWVLSRFVADDRALLLGVLLVLLTPCVDYVIVFTGLAGGDRARLLAATPVLMVLQIAALPIFIGLFAGGDVVGLIELGPFARAFVMLIIIPLAVAALVQAAVRRRRAGSSDAGREHRIPTAIMDVMAAAMVPLLMLTLITVIGSQVAEIGAQATMLLRVVWLYVVFAVVAVAIGRGVAAIARLDVASTRSVMFSAVTRNSLVVLPLALALPPELRIAALAVVSQTLVELVVMVVLVRVVPILVPDRDRHGGHLDRTS